MFEHAAEAPHGVKGSREAAVVFTDRRPPPRRVHRGELTPPGAWRVRNDGPRPCVEPGVSSLVPHLHVGEASVDAVRVDVERGDGHARESNGLTARVKGCKVVPMTKTLHSKTVPAHVSDEGIPFPEVTLYLYRDSNGVQGLLWHKTKARALESYRASLKLEPKRQARREQAARVAAADAERVGDGQGHRVGGRG